MYKMFIDDERNLGDVTWVRYWDFSQCQDISDWVVVRNQEEVEKTIQEFGFPYFISFDHDLGDHIPTGFDITKMLVEKLMDGVYSLPENFSFVVHSKNPIGKKNIEMYLDQYMRISK